MVISDLFIQQVFIEFYYIPDSGDKEFRDVVLALKDL